jgi:diguanylate cyclase (GGDEF)-like protein/PAS domain S-box-containing protein
VGSTSDLPFPHAGDADSILTATAAAAAARPEPPAPPRRHRGALRGRALALIAAGTLLLAWGAASTALHVRAQQERSRSTALLHDDLRRINSLVDDDVTRSELAARRDTQRAWAMTGVGGGVAAVLAVLLLVSVSRSARAAQRLRTAAARAEGERLALRDSERRLRSLVQHASDAVIVLDDQGAVTFATDAVRVLLGRTPSYLLGHNFGEIRAPGPRAELGRLIADSRGRADAVSAELPLPHSDGHTVPVEVRVADRRADPGVGGYVVTLRSVGEQRRLQRQLRSDAVRDRSTGLPNRLRFTEWLDQALTGSAGDALPGVAIVLLDLDDFGTINDSLGPGAGDRLLAAVAERLRGVVTDHGRLARIAGDEFALLLEGVPDVEAAEREARRLLDALDEPVPLEGADVPLTAGLGVALAAPGACGEDLLRSAETALHTAKRRGACQIEVFSPAMHERAVRRLALRSALARAIERGEIDVAYQPIVDTATGLIAGLETLARWELDGVPVAPIDFIPVAEATGLIGALGAIVLERACSDVAGRPRPDGTQLDVGVNVSAVQLRDPGLTASVVAALERSGLPAGNLVLELTESAMVDDSPRVQGALRDLRALGVKLAVDDFGTGWSSLAALASLPVDILKLDRSFVAAMGDSPAHAALLDGVLAMAGHLSLPTVVEGIETEAQLERVRAAGCAFVQGYLLGRPGPLPVPVRAPVA